MKKFYAFAAAVLATMSMNAQLYVVGNGEGLGWTPESPLAVEETEGQYVFDVANLVEFKVSTTMGSWDEFNAGCMTCTYPKASLGTAVALEAGDANIGTPWKGDYHVVVVLGDAPTITLTTETPEPTDPVDIFVRGGMNGWGTDPAWQFSSTDGKNYTFHAEGETKIEAGVEFKIADADWGAVNYGAGYDVPLDEEYEWFHNGDNTTVEADFEGDITFALPDEPKGTIVVTFTTNAGVNSAVIDNNAPVEYFNLQGVRVDAPAAGLYIVRQGDKISKTVVR